MAYATLNTVKLPSLWASYLINNDPSGLTDEEIAQCDADTKGLGHCVDVSEDDEFEPYRGIGQNVSVYTFRTN